MVIDFITNDNNDLRNNHFEFISFQEIFPRKTCFKEIKRRKENEV